MADSTSRDCCVNILNLKIYFTHPVIVTTFFKNTNDIFLKRITPDCGFGFIVKRTSGEIQDAAHCWYWVFVLIGSYDFYFRPRIIAACFKMSFSIRNCWTSFRSFSSSFSASDLLFFSLKEPYDWCCLIQRSSAVTLGRDRLSICRSNHLLLEFISECSTWSLCHRSVSLNHMGYIVTALNFCVQLSVAYPKPFTRSKWNLYLVWL